MQTFSVPVKPLWKTDVLVVGGGCAGVVAAIAAAMQGVTVALVERYGFLGGISTQVLDTFCGFYSRDDQKIVGGIPDRVIEALAQHGEILYRPSSYGEAGQVISYNPATLKVVWETLAHQAGVNSLLHTLVVDVLTEDGRVTGVVAVNKGGFMTISAQVVVDASGDADVAAAAGVPFESAERGPLQAMTTTFKLINVDVDQASLVSKDQLHRLMVEAAETGPYDVTPQGNVTLTPMTGVMSANMTRLTKLDPVDPRQLSQAERVGRSQAMEYFRFMRDKVPGYENAELIDFSTQIGIRESRRIVGAYRLTRDDILSGREFDDAIAKGAWPIEDHRPDGTTVQALARTYEIPYRCLLPLKVEGLLIAGRCLSADHAAHASVRVMAQCMAMGQAAGLAAAITSRRSVLLRQLSIEKLKDRLRKIGAVI